jgi:hypothetical protein
MKVEIKVEYLFWLDSITPQNFNQTNWQQNLPVKKLNEPKTKQNDTQYLAYVVGHRQALSSAVSECRPDRH